MAIKLEPLTFHKKQQDDVKTRKKKVNKKLTVAPEDVSKRHSVHDMMLSEDFFIKEPTHKRISGLLMSDAPLELEVSKSTSMLSISDSKAYTNVVSFLKTSATTTKNKLTTTSTNLMRTKSKQQPKKQGSADLSTFLRDLPPWPTQTQYHHTANPMHIFYLLLETMQHGGYITPNLYIAKELWCQPNVRFTAIDTKISVCDTVRNILQNMNERSDFSDSISIEQDLTVLEITLKSVDRIIKRKLWTTPIQEEQKKPPQKADQHSVVSSSLRRSSYFMNEKVKTAQAIQQWGNKISQSVDKIKFDTNQNEQNTLYIQYLIDIFTHAKLFETWNTKVTGKNELQHLQICEKLFIIIMSKFVIKDYELLLDKWLTQTSSQFLDL